MSGRDAAPSDADPLGGSAHELAAAIRGRTCSAVDVVTAHIAQIERVNDALHAVVALSPAALDDAREADRRLASGAEVGPLHGVPFTAKDWLETRGLVCAAGYEARRNHVPDADATVVARMRAAGAILLGKTKTGSTADLHPPPRNPHDPARTPGASSSGEAAIVAALGSPLGLGSDSGGSLRWPAHCCGVATLKPTSGLVPLTGHYPRIIALSDPRTVIGPIARRVTDLDLVLRVIAGEDGADASVVPMPLGTPGSVSLAGLRLAWFTDFDGAAADERTRETVAHAVDCLVAAGAVAARRVPPRIEEALAITRAYWARPESVSEREWRPWGASTLSADAVEQSLFEWDRLRRAFTAFMRDTDLIVCPVASTAAPARERADAEDYAFTLPFSLTGSPVVVVRAGTSAEGLPLGVQLVARPFRDHVALAAAAALERAVGSWPDPAIARR